LIGVAVKLALTEQFSFVATQEPPLKVVPETQVQVPLLAFQVLADVQVESTEVESSSVEEE
jgi:hypothetical protein